MNIHLGVTALYLQWTTWKISCLGPFWKIMCQIITKLYTHVCDQNILIKFNSNGKRLSHLGVTALYLQKTTWKIYCLGPFLTSMCPILTKLYTHVCDHNILIKFNSHDILFRMWTCATGYFHPPKININGVIGLYIVKIWQFWV